MSHKGHTRDWIEASSNLTSLIHDPSLMQKPVNDLGKLMKTHKVVGLYSGDSYFSGTLDECETYVAYEPADSFKIVPL